MEVEYIIALIVGAVVLYLYMPQPCHQAPDTGNMCDVEQLQVVPANTVTIEQQ